MKKEASGAGSSSDNNREGRRTTVVVKQSSVSNMEEDTEKPEENVCNINNCNRRFVSKESLLAHQRRVHALPTAHVCSHCSTSFSTLPNLNKHVSSKHNHLLCYLCAALVCTRIALLKSNYFVSVPSHQFRFLYFILFFFFCYKLFCYQPCLVHNFLWRA